MGLAVRRLKGLLKALLPSGLKQQLKLRTRSQRLKGIRESEVPITLAEFERALRILGVEAGQILFVHSGADWLQSVEGGPIKILEMLRMILGDEGTLAMPSIPFDGMAAEYIATAAFDVRRSPSKVGLLTELFRRLPEVHRSLHPTHPVCAIGRLSAHLTNSHHLDSRPFGPFSPFGRLEETQGRILMIGVNTDFLTHVHVVEDSMGERFPIPVYFPEPVEVTVVNQEGNTHVLKTLVHNPTVSRVKSISRHEGEWLKLGLLRRSRIGHVELRLIDAGGLSAHLQAQAQRGKTIYG